MDGVPLSLLYLTTGLLLLMLLLLLVLVVVVVVVAQPACVTEAPGEAAHMHRV